MTNVITTQPGLTEHRPFLPLTESSDNSPTAPIGSLEPGKESSADTNLMVDPVTGNVVLKNEEKKEEIRRRRSEDTDCCFALDENDFFATYFCCRMLSDCLVGCGRCTESCCDSCWEGLCNCEGDGNQNGDAGDCCDGGCDCGDCDCGDCGDCGDCDCSCFPD